MGVEAEHVLLSDCLGEDVNSLELDAEYCDCEWKAVEFVISETAELSSFCFRAVHRCGVRSTITLEHSFFSQLSREVSVDA